MSIGQTNTLTIRTPEGIEFSFLLAGPITRFLAWSVDFMAIMAVNKLLTGLFGVLGILSRDLATAKYPGVFCGFNRVWDCDGMVLAWANPW